MAQCIQMPLSKMSCRPLSHTMPHSASASHGKLVVLSLSSCQAMMGRTPIYAKGLPCKCFLHKIRPITQMTQAWITGGTAIGKVLQISLRLHQAAEFCKCKVPKCIVVLHICSLVQVRTSWLSWNVRQRSAQRKFHCPAIQLLYSPSGAMGCFR